MFLCDEMLGDLGRWLRAAGHDTLLAAHGLPDAHWLALARAQSRCFLTRDRKVMEHAAAHGVAVVLPAAGLDAAAAFLRERIALDWLHAPFTRCLLDNAKLLPLDDAHARALHADVAPDTARRCPACARVYWPGSHHRRMLARLRRWAVPAGG